jgi:hypothetical protein
MRNIAQKNKIMSEVKELDRDENISIKSVFGLWKNREIDKGILREKAWKKNWIA